MPWPEAAAQAMCLLCLLKAPIEQDPPAAPKEVLLPVRSGVPHEPNTFHYPTAHTQRLDACPISPDPSPPSSETAILKLFPRFAARSPLRRPLCGLPLHSSQDTL